ncbi:uncharacterized protein [Watersipora subatra]|uniref:uncharacterized protein n=1 Tax=Watersipora subatra TaxID=2589382 RepID=UPI00355B9BA4
MTTQQTFESLRGPVYSVTKPPPGTIVSAYGVRQYHTLETPLGVRNLQLAKSPHVPSKPRTWPNSVEPHRAQSRADVDTEDGSAQAPYQQNTHEFATQTDDKPTVATAPRKDSVPNGAIKVDTATSPIDLHPYFTEEASSALRRSYGNRSVVTEDYRNVLSRRSDDLWDDRRSVSIIFPDPEVGSLPTPLPTRSVGVMADRKLITPTSTKNQATQSDDVQGVTYLQPAFGETSAVYNVSPYIYREAPAKRIIIKRAAPLPPQQQIYVIQNDERSDSDDESTHHYYGPNQQPMPPLSTYHGYPYQQNCNTFLPIQPQYGQRQFLDEPRGSEHMKVQLKYGRLIRGPGGSQLPREVEEELLREYGSVKAAEADITVDNGNYSIHSYRK